MGILRFEFIVAALLIAVLFKTGADSSRSSDLDNGRDQRISHRIVAAPDNASKCLKCLQDAETAGSNQLKTEQAKQCWMRFKFCPPQYTLDKRLNMCRKKDLNSHFLP
ncbi:uncharacterized protein LOC132203392 [Neocloeon triangulifer]|uniref:uncharacterized protein LOC132203392 n=1 Tax=Neocloeon triangulifer TaxID=2078957 RepID=UPI00286F77DC|nr:uncharacterized protein LOC132203392 [Neocloeon triangulifer]